MKTLAVLLSVSLASCTQYTYIEPGVWYIEDITTTECDNAKGLELWLQENP